MADVRALRSAHPRDTTAGALARGIWIAGPTYVRDYKSMAATFGKLAFPRLRTFYSELSRRR